MAEARKSRLSCSQGTWNRGETGWKELRLPPGTCFIYPPKEPQLYSGDGVGLGNDAFHFSGAVAAEILKRFKIPLKRPLHPQSSTRMTSILSMLHEEYLNPSQDSEEASEHLFSLLCLELSRQTRKEPDGHAPSPRQRELRERISAVRGEMLRRMEEPWSVKSLSKAAGIGRSRLCSIYKELFGASPIDELIEFRLRKARYMLSGGRCTVAETAEACGFSSIQYFCRLFKRRTGETPGSLQRK